MELGLLALTWAEMETTCMLARTKKLFIDISCQFERAKSEIEHTGSRSQP